MDHNSDMGTNIFASISNSDNIVLGGRRWKYNP